MNNSAPFLLLLVLGSGLMHILKPEWIWELTQQWKTQNAQKPSAEYLSATRVRGWVILAGGLLLIGVLISIAAK